MKYSLTFFFMDAGGGTSRTTLRFPSPLSDAQVQFIYDVVTALSDARCSEVAYKITIDYPPPNPAALVGSDNDRFIVFTFANAVPRVDFVRVPSYRQEILSQSTAVTVEVDLLHPDVDAFLTLLLGNMYIPDEGYGGGVVTGLDSAVIARRE